MVCTVKLCPDPFSSVKLEERVVGLWRQVWHIQAGIKECLDLSFLVTMSCSDRRVDRERWIDSQINRIGVSHTLAVSTPLNKSKQHVDLTILMLMFSRCNRDWMWAQWSFPNK